MSMRLYEISDQYQFLLKDLYNEETGEVDESVLSRLNELSDTAENKCINVVRIFKEIEMQRVAIAEEKKRMAARESALKNQVDRLKNYLLVNMERCQIKKIECPQFVISLQKNPARLDITDEKLIPKEYLVTKISIDESKVKDELKSGVIIPGARLVQGNSVRIR